MKLPHAGCCVLCLMGTWRWQGTYSAQCIEREVPQFFVASAPCWSHSALHCQHSAAEVPFCTLIHSQSSKWNTLTTYRHVSHWYWVFSPWLYCTGYYLNTDNTAWYCDKQRRVFFTDELQESKKWAATIRPSLLRGPRRTTWTSGRHKAVQVRPHHEREHTGHQPTASDSAPPIPQSEEADEQLWTFGGNIRHNEGRRKREKCISL